jgi:hypothetical protein
VEVERQEERVEVQPGWYWIPTAQSRANLISYLLEPETDDNLVTWGWTDHVLQVRPGNVEEAMAEMLEGRDPSAIPPEQLERMRARLEEQLTEGQRVPMIRVTEHQRLPVVRVQPFNQYQRNRYDLPH